MYNSEDEFKLLQIAVKLCCSAMLKEVMHNSCFVEESIYFDWVAERKSEVIKFLPVDYLGFKHKHKDTYVHFSTVNTLKRIVKCGYLTKEFSCDSNSVGKAVYIYPLGSGIYFSNDNFKEDYGFLVFELNETHYHITQTDSSVKGIGEADFFTDSLIITNPKILSYSEIKKLSNERFNWSIAWHDYFGLKSATDLRCKEEMCYILEKYNS